MQILWGAQRLEAYYYTDPVLAEVEVAEAAGKMGDRLPLLRNLTCGSRETCGSNGIYGPRECIGDPAETLRRALQVIPVAWKSRRQRKRALGY